MKPDTSSNADTTATTTGSRRVAIHPGAIYAEGAEGAVLGKGFYVGVNKAGVEKFGPKIEGAEVTLENPLVINNDKDLRAFLGKDIPPDNETRSRLFPAAVAKAKEAGHDGIVANLRTGADMDSQGNSVKRMREIFDVSQVVKFEPKAERNLLLENEEGARIEAEAREARGEKPQPQAPTGNPALDWEETPVVDAMEDALKTPVADGSVPVTITSKDGNTRTLKNPKNANKQAYALIYKALRRTASKGETEGMTASMAANLWKRIGAAVSRYRGAFMGINFSNAPDVSGGFSLKNGSLTINIPDLTSGANRRTGVDPSTKTPDEFRNAIARINALVQEEAIHSAARNALAKYIAEHPEVTTEWLWDALPEKTRNEVVRLYSGTRDNPDGVAPSGAVQKDQLFHEYVRMVIQGNVESGVLSEGTSLGLREVFAEMWDEILRYLKDFAATINGMSKEEAAHVAEVVNRAEAEFRSFTGES